MNGHGDWSGVWPKFFCNVDWAVGWPKFACQQIMLWLPKVVQSLRLGWGLAKVCLPVDHVVVAQSCAVTEIGLGAG